MTMNYFFGKLRQNIYRLVVLIFCTLSGGNIIFAQVDENQEMMWNQRKQNELSQSITQITHFLKSAQNNELQLGFEKNKRDYMQTMDLLAAEAELSAKQFKAGKYEQKTATEIQADKILRDALRNLSPAAKKFLRQSSHRAIPQQSQQALIFAANATTPKTTNLLNLLLQQALFSQLATGDSQVANDNGESAMDVLADGAAYFDQENKLIVFVKNVKVLHPQFTIEAPKLELFLNESAKLVEGDSEIKSAAPPSQENAIRLAIASGGLVTMRRKSDVGKVQVGKAKTMIFESSSGDVTMYDWPQIQMDNKMVIATSKGTVFVIKQNGKLIIKGPSTTKIVSGAK